MSTYVQPTREEFEDLLPNFRLLDLPKTVELVFGKRVDRNGTPLSLRIYSSLNPNGKGRDCGKDAIRVEVFMRRNDGKILRVGGSKRVNRVAGWQDRLADRIRKWEGQLGPSCPDCTAPMILRKGGNGQFFGCSNYPNCKGTRQKEGK